MYYKSNCYCQKCKAWDLPLIKNSLSKSKSATIRNYMCRSCTSERIRRYYHNNKKRCKDIISRSIKKFQYKQDARGRLNYSVRMGYIDKPTSCEICKQEKPRIEGHHHDYSKPLDVEWLCTDCHADKDKAMVLLKG